MVNIVESDDTTDFYVFVDPKDPVIRHQVGMIGSFYSIPPDPDGSTETLMFLPNPNYKTFISPFQNNVLRNYRAEYNLEISRQRHYSNYSSRLNAMFLLWNRENADKYQIRHPDHVGDRILKKVHSVGPFKYSLHDSAWINFLRLGHSMDETVLEFCWSFLLEW